MKIKYAVSFITPGVLKMQTCAKEFDELTEAIAHIREQKGEGYEVASFDKVTYESLLF